MVNKAIIKQVWGPELDINNCDVFTIKNENSYAVFVSILSNIFMKAHACSLFRDIPYKAALIINDPMTKPYNKGGKEPESALDRITHIISRMRQPIGGIQIGIFVGNSDKLFVDKKNVGLKHTTSHCWTIDRPEQPRDFITINLPPERFKALGKNHVRWFSWKEIMNDLKNSNVHHIDYKTPIKTVFDKLDKGAVHVSYQGGTAWLSVCMNIPTIILHHNISEDERNLKFKIFGQDVGTINFLNGTQIVHARRHPSEHHVHVTDFGKTLRKLLK